MNLAQNHVNKKIELTFKVFKNHQDELVINIEDQLGRKTSKKMVELGGMVASNMLALWANYHLRHDLIKLAGKGTSYEFVSETGEQSWGFRDNVEFFGLHDRVRTTGTVDRVSIETHIGMKNVVAILNNLGYSVVNTFDQDKNRMEKILLSKE